METLLSHSFDYLSSASPQKVRKGLRQVEGLLAQICLASSSASSSPAKNQRHSMLALGSPPSSPPPKKLTHLNQDLAFREFYKLQQSFQWNVAMRLIGCLERLLGKGSTGTNDLLIVQTLDLIQGVLLLHPPSRDLFARELHMTLFLDLLDPSLCPAIQSSTLLALVASLLDSPANARTFEACDGLLVVTSLFKSRSTSREVKLNLVEFLYFYLMPETAPRRSSPLVQTANGTGPPQIDVLGNRRKEVVAAFDRGRRRDSSISTTAGAATNNSTAATAPTNTRSTDEKQALLGRYLNNVQDLVEDLAEGANLFGRSR